LDQVLNHPQLMAMAQGSPGTAIQHWQQLQAISPEFLQTLSKPPQSLRQALAMARQIDEALDLEAQLWLIDYLQHCYWQQQCHPQQLQPLELARQQLLNYAQPRLVWEVALIALIP
jgi:DNA polymerase III subunit delta'